MTIVFSMLCFSILPDTTVCISFGICFVLPSCPNLSFHVVFRTTSYILQPPTRSRNSFSSCVLHTQTEHSQNLDL